MLSRAEVRRVYDQTGTQQDSQSIYEDAALDVLRAHAALESADTVFEVGCGTGRFAERLLREELPSRARYVGVDLSSTMARLARERLAPYADRATVWQTEGALAFDVPSASQDRVVATYVLDLLPPNDIRAFLEEACRLLRKNGRLCLAGLTEGHTLPSRVVSRLWSAVHALRPAWVGGCRPLRTRRFMEPRRWDVLHHDILSAWGVPSEVLVAAPREP